MPDLATQLDFAARLIVAAALGGLVGAEREIHGHPAGIRTHMLVALGSALFTVMSIHGFGQGSGSGIDPTRIVAQIVTGIGFLGAGVIFREGYTVRGITTAATIWSAAAVGMAVGRELYLAAGLGSLLIFLLLEARPVVRRMDNFVGTLLLGLKAHEDTEREDAAEGRGKDE